jgi:uncharacterized protein (DUF58 family)
MASLNSTLAQLWAKAERPGVRAFFLSIAALGVALVLALYSGAAAELNQTKLSVVSALAALIVAGWVGVTLVPVLARRTPLRWLGYRIEYRVTSEGWFYIAGVLLIALAAMNTGNNLLFLILATLIAVILMSGVLSSISLSGVSMRLELPEHIFAGHTVRAVVELENEKLTLPSFALRVEGAKMKGAAAPASAAAAGAVLDTPVYFPYLSKKGRAQQSIPITFARRGAYRQDAFRIVTRFPFGFLQKARRVELPTEAIVYPNVEPTQELFDVLGGLQGALESMSKGRGQDLYALRDYVPTDSARHVHWKASARLGSLMVREFTREDDCRVLLVLDPHMDARAASERFERAVTLCAGIAWHLFERNAQLQFRTAGLETELAPADRNIFPILRHLALAQPVPPDPQHILLTDLAASPELFKIIVTSQAHGSIPGSIWHSSYVVFLEDLEPWSGFAVKA